jgi:NAD(P)-dependent dehydrogenase (short-subunit alcohol dehydrogenase family)
MVPIAAGAIGEERFLNRVRQVVPLKKLRASEQIAEAIVFLAATGSKFTTGTNLVVDGGWTAQ